DGDDLVRGGLVDDLAHAGGTGEGDLRDAVRGRQCHAGFFAEAVDDVEDAGRQEVGDLLHEVEKGGRGLLRGLEHDGVAGGQGGGDLPGGHEDGEVPRDDLRDDAQRLVEVVGHGVLV